MSRNEKCLPGCQCRRHPGGTPEQIEANIHARFWAKVDRGGEGCWLWMAAKTRYGYGAFSISTDKNCTAHRYAYQLLKGPIPEGLELDHLCRNRACVNPDHLEAVTHRVNALRGEAPTIRIWRQGTCTRGHEWTPENTYIAPGSGARQCRTCNWLNKVRQSGRDPLSVRRRPYPPTHCPQGHEYTPENTAITPGRGDRRCLICRKQSAAKWYSRIKNGRRPNPQAKAPTTITFQDRTLTIAQWAEERGMSSHALRARLKEGWTPERALSTPLRPRGPNRK